MSPSILGIWPMLLHVISIVFFPAVQWSAITVTYNEAKINSIYKINHTKNIIHHFFSKHLSVKV